MTFSKLNFTVVWSIAGAVGLLVCLLDLGTQARPLSDRTLSLVVGADPNIKGSGTYDCVDAQITASNGTYIRSTGCGSLNNNAIPNPAPTCIACTGGPSDYGSYTDPNGNPIVFKSNVDCSKLTIGTTTTASTLNTQGACGPSMASGKGTCAGPTRATANACTSGFAKYGKQLQTGP